VQASLSVYEVSLEIRKDVGGALELANRRHFDGFIIDCDGVQVGWRYLPIYAAPARTGKNRSFLPLLTELRG
jgi:hypothetical protein